MNKYFIEPFQEKRGDKSLLWIPRGCDEKDCGHLNSRFAAGVVGGAASARGGKTNNKPTQVIKAIEETTFFIKSLVEPTTTSTGLPSFFSASAEVATAFSVVESCRSTLPPTKKSAIVLVLGVVVVVADHPSETSIQQKPTTKIKNVANAGKNAFLFLFTIVCTNCESSGETSDLVGVL